VLGVLLGCTAGVMLGATIFSLLVPALDRGGAGSVLLGFLIGGGVLGALDVVVPHAHARLREGKREPAERVAAEQRAVLLLAALTIHNIPEGLAVGVAFGAGGVDLGVPVALAIGIQNVPEGFAAAAPLIPAGTSARMAAGIAAATGAVEPPAAFLGFAMVGLAGAALPAMLGFAAGAMLYVIVDELIPESHAGGHQLGATFGLLGGFAVMVMLDTAL
jgi:ZIP family zinc transporter